MEQQELIRLFGATLDSLKSITPKSKIKPWQYVVVGGITIGLLYLGSRVCVKIISKKSKNNDQIDIC